jgi:hypothetical protein
MYRRRSRRRRASSHAARARDARPGSSASAASDAADGAAWVSESARADATTSTVTTREPSTAATAAAAADAEHSASAGVQRASALRNASTARHGGGFTGRPSKLSPVSVSRGPTLRDHEVAVHHRSESHGVRLPRQRLERLAPARGRRVDARALSHRGSRLDERHLAQRPARRAQGAPRGRSHRSSSVSSRSSVAESRRSIWPRAPAGMRSFSPSAVGEWTPGT